MENKFLVGMCRFHIKKENCFLITGSFQKNEAEGNQLEVYLDKEKLPVTIEEKDLPMSELKTGPGFLITKSYYLWIELPNGWEEGKKLILVNREKGKKHTCVEIPVDKLKKHEKRLCKHIDKGRMTEKGFEIVGWYVNEEPVDIRFYDKKGKEYPVQIQQKQRSDVRRAFPESDKEDVTGFKAEYFGKSPKEIKICFRSDKKQADYKVSFQTSFVEKQIRFLRKGSRKVKAYYSQFGMKATAMRVVEKIMHRDTIAYQTWFKMQSPSQTLLKKQSEQKFPYMPKISIVVPLYKTPEKYLKEMIESVQQQTYSNWELCLSDGSGTDSPLTSLLKKYTEQDKRIKVISSDNQLQISENTNQALKIATGDFIAFGDHDDLFAPNALYECVYALNEEKDIDIIYTDEDKIDMKGEAHFMPHFKPDFNIDMLRSMNYICHLFVVRRSIYEQAGMLDPKFNGAQDYDFVLRCVEKTNRIKHIPKVLYHWRAHKDSTAENPESKRYAFEAGVRAIQAHYDRLGIPATVKMIEKNGIYYRTKYLFPEKPLVSVIIPNKDHKKDLEKCLKALEEKNTYDNIEYVIVENNSTEEETFAYYKELEENHPKVKVLYWEGTGFNYPSINNFGVEHSNGEYLLFLNNDTEIINADCIEELLGFCMREDVGAVGARLYYEDGTIQHAGVIVGLGGVAGHAFVGFAHDDPGYFGRIGIVQDYSAVTAACMMVKRTVFEEVKGFDERYAVAFNDVDFCLKIREAGYLIVYNPYAELMHYESKSRGYEDTEEKVNRFNSEIELFQKRWSEFLKKGDPFYSPNLTLDKNDFSIGFIK